MSDPHQLAPWVPDPETGEPISPAGATDEQLAAIAVMVQAKKRDADDVLSIVKHELRKRLDANGQRKRQAGPFEVQIKHESVWDVGETERVVRDLVNRKLINPAECVGLIKRDVSKSVATKLLRSLADGPGKHELEGARHWRAQSGVTVLAPRGEPVIEATAEEEEAPALRPSDDTDIQAPQHHPAAPDGAHLRGARGPAGATEEEGGIPW